MPNRPKVPCGHPLCPNLIEAGRYCEDHGGKRKPRGRSASYQKLYGRRWRKASRAFLANNPLCACGCNRLAECVDHIEPHRGDERKFWDRDNWQPMTKRCHDRKTARGR